MDLEGSVDSDSRVLAIGMAIEAVGSPVAARATGLTVRRERVRLQRPAGAGALYPRPQRAGIAYRPTFSVPGRVRRRII